MRVLQVVPNRFRLKFDRVLQGPKEANAVQVVLPAGQLLQGPNVDRNNDAAGC